jgi:hypothetical protein
MKLSTYFGLCIVLLMLSMLLAGCSRGGPSQITLIEVHKGRGGLDMGYLDGMPPLTVFSSTDDTESLFPVAVQLTNKGATDITNGYVSFSLEKDYIEFELWNINDADAFQVGTSDENIAFSLLGRSQLNPVGEQNTIALTLRALALDPQSETHPTSVIMTACYAYETKAAAEICIDPELFSTKAINKVCTAKPVTLAGGQGSPIAVSKIETKMLPGPGGSVQPQFIIHVQNLGKGQATNKDSVAKACSSQPLDANDWNIIGLRDLRFSRFSSRRGDFICSQVPLRLHDGSGIIKCTLKPNLLRKDEGSFKTTLFVGLEYGYTQSVSKTVQLERITR